MKGMATCSSILAWRIPWTEEPVGVIESDMTERLVLSLFHFHFQKWAHVCATCRDTSTGKHICEHTDFRATDTQVCLIHMGAVTNSCTPVNTWASSRSDPHIADLPLHADICVPAIHVGTSSPSLGA